MSQARDLADLGGSASAGGITGRNLIINGAMAVVQRGTSSTSAGYLIDRFEAAHSQVAVTQSQQTLTSGSPYDSGFRHFYRLANTSVSSATNAFAEVHQIFEAKNISQSGWNYKSTSSFITISFWARSSLAGTYYVMLRTFDGTEYRRNLPFTLVADTWTKVEVTTAGNSNLQIDNDAESGLTVFVVPHYGTDFTGGGEVSTTDWYDRNGQSDAYLPNYAQNWSNTESATFDITGVKLEAGQTATSFEHEDIATTLVKCQRYYQKIWFRANNIFTDFTGTQYATQSLVNPIRTDGGTITNNVTTGANISIDSMLIVNKNTLQITCTSSGVHNNWVTGNVFVDAEL